MVCLVAVFTPSEMTLCGRQDVRTQLLTNNKLTNYLTNYYSSWQY